MKRQIAGQLILGGLELVPDQGLCRVTWHHTCLTSQALSARRQSIQPDFDVYPAILTFYKAKPFFILHIHEKPISIEIEHSQSLGIRGAGGSTFFLSSKSPRYFQRNRRIYYFVLWTVSSLQLVGKKDPFVCSLIFLLKHILKRHSSLSAECLLMQYSGHNRKYVEIIVYSVKWKSMRLLS